LKTKKKKRQLQNNSNESDMNRREFISNSAAGCCGTVIGGNIIENAVSAGIITGDTSSSDLGNFLNMTQDDFRKLADTAIFTAGKNGAGYSDLRICRNRNQSVSAREDRVQNISDNSSLGFGVRVLVNGTWGFASSHLLNEDSIAKMSILACEMAKANSILQKTPVELVHTPSYTDSWSTPVKINPYSIPISEKIERLLEFNNIATKQGANFCDSFMWFINEWKLFASSEGSFIEQDLYRAWVQANPTVIDKATGDFGSRKTLNAPMSKGFEYVDEYPFEEDIRTAVDNAKMKLSAPSVTESKRDLILHPSNLWLTIHESCGHPTELDRALGYEANYAGTSFMTTDKLGKLQYGSELINMVADRTQEFGLATRGYDDDGVKTTEWSIIKDGVFVDYQTTRDLAPLIGNDKSYACAYADNWNKFPIQRMPNISLQPGRTKKSIDDLISETEDAILILGDGSWSIDMQRYNFQFTGQEFWEIKNGKKTGMLKDVAYQGNTIDFWNSCDALCSEEEYFLGGSLFCGKGEPGQISPVSHGSVPARFRQVNILNTKSQI